ncbi:cryptochrome/photolyase family protein [Microbulbifer sp. A4B17]|uniref:cryptochrome/photolyase family protein n=1 Tax=Microbulbifer sp. A4B17 TaxID=359370 RepID=UPI000D52E8FE|nr:cryptochrome/photolyase family protein [Microbulbifer sp. A4B17]AWF82981.1 cryptochrome/photolyase family protein [Microbulbifer sp. A4B17]
MKTLRLLLGDQLNQKHSWFRGSQENTIYFMAEMRQETDYTVHHIQKIIAFFEAMEKFSEWIRNKGIKVIYYRLNDKKNKQNLIKNIEDIVSRHKIEKFEYQLPDEYRLDQQLQQLKGKLSIESQAYDTEHFLTDREELCDFFHGKNSLLMESFYRHMRKKHKVLMNNEKPEGGKWNFDQSNRKKWNDKLGKPKQYQLKSNVTSTLARIKKSGVKSIGKVDPENFIWPTSREDSIKLLRHFCQYLLPHFGDFQDAMDPNEVFLYHSRISFSLNSKLISPKEAIDTAIKSWKEGKASIGLNQIEGFVRQILGWREYMRGVYWMSMPDYENQNKLKNSNDLPDFFWNAETSMNCLHKAIQNSLDNAYAHHIQRLMITGNFALLTQTHPDQVESWYLGIYIDAIQWVEMPNTRGMSQFADGGLVATKPYISSGSYINKMSNYCRDCIYDVKQRTGENACPFNSLYWNFLIEKRKLLKDNHRMSMMFNLLDKIERKELVEIQRRAKKFMTKKQ